MCKFALIVGSHWQFGVLVRW